VADLSGIALVGEGTPKELWTDRKAMTRSSAVVTLLSLATAGANFGLQIVIAYVFGAGAYVDTYFAATTVPLTLMTLVSGSITAGLVPYFVSQRREQGERALDRLISSLLVVCACGLATLVLMGIGFAPSIVRLTLPGFGPEDRKVVVQLFEILFIAVFFGGLNGLLVAAHNARGRFWVSAIAPFVGAVSAVCFLLLMSSSLGVYAIAWATTVGTMAQTMIVSLAAKPVGAFALGARSAELGKAFALVAPLIAAQVFGQSHQLIARFLGSSLERGAISALAYALRLVGVLQVLTSSGLSVVGLPWLSSQATDRGSLGNSLSRLVRLALVAFLPPAALLALLRVPIITVLFQRGAFDSQAVTAASEALLYYSGILLLTVATGGLVSTFLYSLQRSGLVALLWSAEAVVNATLAAFLVRPLGFKGIALAFSLAHAFTLIAVLICLKPLGIRLQPGLGRFVGKVAAAIAISGLAASESYRLLVSLCAGPAFHCVAGRLVGAVAVYALVYLWMLTLLRIPEVTLWRDILRRDMLVPAFDSLKRVGWLQHLLP
jgi:putative peptidoglycan lipid II flippase